MRYQSFSVFGPWGANPWAKVHQKGRWPVGLWDLPSCKISSLYANPRSRYPLQKILQTHTHRLKNKQTNKQTVNDISTTCLSACVDNNSFQLKQALFDLLSICCTAFNLLWIVVKQYISNKCDFEHSCPKTFWLITLTNQVSQRYQKFWQIPHKLNFSNMYHSFN